MKSRFFNHDLNLSLAIFQMAFQVKFLAGRNENSCEMFINGTSTMFCYKNAAHDDVELIDGKAADGSEDIVKVTKRNVRIDLGIFMIKDTDKTCYHPVNGKYISSDPHILSNIRNLLTVAYPEGFPEDFPTCHFSSENNQTKLLVIGEKAEIIRFTDALLALVNKLDMKLVTPAEEKDDMRKGLN